MAGIFISYRRKDSAGTTGRLYEHLKSALIGNNIFVDTQVISAGDNFGTRIQSHINECDILIAVIGDRWIGADQPNRIPRIQDPSDWVRREIETALSRNIKIIPVLVDGMTVPQMKTSLPKSLKSLIFLNAIPVRNGYEFKQDTQRLVDDIRQYLAEQEVLEEKEQRLQEKKDSELVVKLDKGRLRRGSWRLVCKEIKGFSKGLSAEDNRFYFVSDKRYTFQVRYSFDESYYARSGQTSGTMEFGKSAEWSGFLPRGIHTFECGLVTGLTISNVANFAGSVLSIARLNPVTLYLKPIDYKKPH